MWWSDRESSEGKDPYLIDTQAFWGDNFFVDVTSNGEQKKNYFVDHVAQVARYAVPFLHSISKLIKWKY